MEVNLVVLVGFIMSIIALIIVLTFACIDIYRTIRIRRFTNNKDITHIISNNYEISEQDYVEMLLSSRNELEFNRKLKKYINTQRMDVK